MSRKTKYAIGIFEEGQNLYVACLVKEDDVVKIVNTNIFNFEEAEGNIQAPQKASAELVSAEALLEKEAAVQEKASVKTAEKQKLKDDDIQLTMGEGEDEFSLDDDALSNLQHDVVAGSKSGSGDNFALPGLKDESFKYYADLIYRIWQKYPRSSDLVFSFQEPKVYYTNFYTDWGLEGPKLKQKIIQELSTEKADFGVHIPDQVDILRSAGGDIIAVSSDVVSDFRAVGKEFQLKYKKHLPHISFIECDATSLINLINLNYQFSEDEITVIIYVGTDNTRLIFMQGNQLLHISPSINEGTDSILIFETIYNKITLEQDNLNLAKIDHIFTAGEANEMGVKTYLASMFPGDVKKTVEDIELKNLFVQDTEQFTTERLVKFAIPIGAAWRALERKNENLLKIDLIPSKLRESQKLLKLGLTGWITFVMIFVLSLFFTLQISEFKKELFDKRNEIQVKQIELTHLQALDQELTKANERLDYFKKTYSVLDSMLSRTQDCNKFLTTVANDAKNIGGIWISEITPEGPNLVQLSGFSLHRNRISNFSESLGGTTLKMVETGEIREKTVYRFQLEAKIPFKERMVSDEAVAQIKPEALGHNPSIQAHLTKPKIQSEMEFQAKYEQARSLFNRYRYQEAITEFSVLIESGFNSELVVNCYYWIGECYFGIHQYDKAIENFMSVLPKESLKRIAAIYMLGRAYAAKGDYENSRRYMDQVINQYPNEPLAKKATNFKRKLR